MEVLSDHGEILFATENGYGKKVRIADFRVAHRGGMGVRTIPTDKRNGPVIGLAIVHEDSHILLIDQAGKIICLSAKDIRAMGRQAKGVRLIRLDADQKLHNVVAFEGGDDAADASGDETGVVIETRSLPVTEDAGDDEEEDGELEDEEESEEDEIPSDLEYEDEDADDVDEDEEVEL
jgi:DNA gyrase subunit A